MQPSTVPIASPTKITMGAGSPSLEARIAALYCATEAVAAKEMSIPPETSTTNKPIAIMACTEYVSSRSMMLASERKSLAVRLSTAPTTRITASNHASGRRRSLPSRSDAATPDRLRSRIDALLHLVLVYLSGHVLAHDAPGPHMEHPITSGKNLGNLIRDENDANSLPRQVGHDLVDSLLVLDVDAYRGRVEDQYLRRGGQPFRQDNALLVPAGKRLHGTVDARNLNGKAFYPARGQRATRLAGNQTEGPSHVLHDGKDDVVADRLRQDHTMAEPVLGNVRDTGTHGVAI